ncbi:hypothetical protein KDH_27850 [Dictyobacter sp. S3.2.2.5]|uniref:IstB-like ATP-binding domain-containing protein n=1 Tax=Dictyobacter halimunensis TaxID=3026934 RepID=A0ABQ6FT06_9CHLR|nr:hypothetical protein KDH_27850 [Dictyobacter sp. S3.2.2.5]
MKPNAAMYQGARRLPYTHLTIGLALAACRHGKRVRFYKTAALVNDLQVAQKTLILSNFMARFTRLDLLILDELGFIAVDKAGGQFLFQLVGDLYEQISLVITSNLRFGDWNSIFGDPTLTIAFLDRLIHKGRIVEFVGESYRYLHRLQQAEAWAPLFSIFSPFLQVGRVINSG